MEESITRLEGKIEQEMQALIDASVKGDGDSIRRLNKSIQDAKGSIERLFDDLASLTDELSAQSREFDERLEALRGIGV